ncbi:toxin-antitoxin system YwqK family antitoxin [Hyunsoonleella ulvae]|uniref:toxin-antitoxin system YwqK family antitoxin n=1 Tax=Hyunsoonleella ulvae TaxID=2799948 RepID=UPI0019398B62|nr:hypothetical protein [Hyunsoonleella ulvae]
MKQFLVLMTILVSVVSKAQTLSSWDEIKLHRFGTETVYKSINNRPINGLYKIASANGSYSEIFFKKGKIHGVRKNYSSDERLISTQSYLNGKRDGEWTYYDEDGKPKTIENYKEGLKTGKWWKKAMVNSSYYTSISFYENNIPTGRWIEKWKNGTLKEERIFNGKGSYTQKKYHANGKLYEQKSYKNFKLNGNQFLYSKAGILLKKELFAHNVLEKRESFFDNGRPREVYNFKNGKLHGTCIDYKSSGAKSYEGIYENGYKSGVFKKYVDSNGWLYYETSYENDVANGPHKTYYRSKLVEQEGNYLNGSKNGIWKFYNIAGKLIREVEYDMGTEIMRREYNH